MNKRNHDGESLQCMKCHYYDTKCCLGAECLVEIGEHNSILDIFVVVYTRDSLRTR